MHHRTCIINNSLQQQVHIWLLTKTREDGMFSQVYMYIPLGIHATSVEAVDDSLYTHTQHNTATHYC